MVAKYFKGKTPTLKQWKKALQISINNIVLNNYISLSTDLVRVAGGSRGNPGRVHRMTDNKISERKMINNNKTPHRRLKIGQHEPHKK